ncbi:hypothetical protein HDU77_010913 [Chytriomyces hyalinus]|nr:hypothetical protein HDU77_010913 [Chytriomyces hyalinus]
MNRRELDMEDKQDSMYGPDTFLDALEAFQPPSKYHPNTMHQQMDAGFQPNVSSYASTSTPVNTISSNSSAANPFAINSSAGNPYVINSNPATTANPFAATSSAGNPYAINSNPATASAHYYANGFNDNSINMVATIGHGNSPSAVSMSSAISGAAASHGPLSASVGIEAPKKKRRKRRTAAEMAADLQKDLEKKNSKELKRLQTSRQKQIKDADTEKKRQDAASESERKVKRFIWSEEATLEVAALFAQLKDEQLALELNNTGFVSLSKHVEEHLSQRKTFFPLLLNIADKVILNRHKAVCKHVKHIKDTCSRTGGGGFSDLMDKMGISSAVYYAFDQVYRDHAGFQGDGEASNRTTPIERSAGRMIETAANERSAGSMMETAVLVAGVSDEEGEEGSGYDSSSSGDSGMMQTLGGDSGMMQTLGGESFRRTQSFEDDADDQSLQSPLILKPIADNASNQAPSSSGLVQTSTVSTPTQIRPAQRAVLSTPLVTPSPRAVLSTPLVPPSRPRALSIGAVRKSRAKSSDSANSNVNVNNQDIGIMTMMMEMKRSEERAEERRELAEERRRKHEEEKEERRERRREEKEDQRRAEVALQQERDEKRAVREAQDEERRTMMQLAFVEALKKLSKGNE